MSAIFDGALQGPLDLRRWTVERRRQAGGRRVAGRGQREQHPPVDRVESGQALADQARDVGRDR